MNLRPSGYEPDELPDCSTPQLEPRIIGIEPRRGKAISMARAVARPRASAVGLRAVDPAGPSSGRGSFRPARGLAPETLTAPRNAPRWPSRAAGSGPLAHVAPAHGHRLQGNQRGERKPPDELQSRDVLAPAVHGTERERPQRAVLAHFVDRCTAVRCAPDDDRHVIDVPVPERRFVFVRHHVT